MTASGHRLMRGSLAAAASAALVFLSPPALAGAEADPDRPTHNLYGVTGTIETPSAEMQPEGEVSVTSSFFGGFLRNTITAQPFPGLEASFRYSTLDDFFDRESETTLFDRSFDVKLRFLREGPRWPGMVLGFQDFLGTGIYSGEYVAATKTFLGGDLRLTGGVGWGRFAGINGVENPLTGISDRFETRDDPDDTGGTVNFGSFFQGERMGLFAGVEWETPLDGLTLKAEYAEDDYGRERRFNDFEPEAPVNLGLEYRPLDWLDIGAYYMFGAEVGVRVTVSGNVFEPVVTADTEPAPLPFLSRPRTDGAAARAELGRVEEIMTPSAPTVAFDAAGVGRVEVEERVAGVRWATAHLPASAGYDCPLDAAPAIDAEFGVIDAVSFRHADGTVVCTVALRPEGKFAVRLTRREATEYPTAWHADEAARARVIEAVRTELAADEIEVFATELMPERVSLYIENRRYRATPRAIGRAARALARNMPASVEHFEIVPVESTVPVVAVTLRRSVLEDRVNRPGAARDAWLSAGVASAAPLDTDRVEIPDGRFPRPFWSVRPSVPIGLFDPDQPVRADVAIRGTAGIEVAPGLSFTGTVQKRLVGDLDDIERDSDSEVRRVRSDIARYLEEGDPALLRLTGDYLTKLRPDTYARVSAGLLERQYGGVSGEVLWKPAEQSWGLGLEVNLVRQRGFDTLFDFRSFHQVTSHASLYWDTPVRGVSMQVDAGRYLAGDYGATFTLKRRFSNGWEIGGFATFTDIPFDEFGEGSFDKGIFLTIPLNWTLPFESRSEIESVIRPLTRDGGQRVQIENRLYGIVEDADRGGLRASWGSFWE